MSAFALDCSSRSGTRSPRDRAGVVVGGAKLAVLSWNAMAEELWGLRQDEVRGSHLLNLDIGLPVETLRDPIRASLAGSADTHELLVDATNRRGKAIRCRVTITPMREGSGNDPRRDPRDGGRDRRGVAWNALTPGR